MILTSPSRGTDVVTMALGRYDAHMSKKSITGRTTSASGRHGGASTDGCYQTIHSKRGSGGGARTTVRVPPEVEPELGLIEEDGATRGAALQELLREGAQARASKRADAEAVSRLREAFAVGPSRVPGFPDDADVEILMSEVRAE